MKDVTLVEDHWLAAWAARVMGSTAVAVVIGRRIYLHGASPAFFLSQEGWVAHELAHVQQYERLGLVCFLVQYAWYSLRYGYRENPLEIAAREAEKQAPASGYQFKLATKPIP